MKTKKIHSFIATICLAIVLPLSSFAQTKAEAVEAYNSGAALINDDPKAALDKLYRALEICEDLEYEAQDIKELTESLIPRAHYGYAMILYRQKKNYETLDQLEKALQTSKKYFDKNTQGRVERIIPQLYNQMGNGEYRSDNYEKAINYFQKAIEIKPDYPDPYLGIALSNEKQEKFDDMLEYLKKTLEVANQVNDKGKAEDALKKANSYLLSNAQEAERAKNFLLAINFYTKYTEFDPNDGTILFKIGENYLNNKDWDSAISYFNATLEKINGSLEPALIYYQIGVAYQGKNLKDEACEAFSKALSGQYEANAKYQMEQVLKCN